MANGYVWMDDMFVTGLNTEREWEWNDLCTEKESQLPWIVQQTNDKATHLIN